MSIQADAQDPTKWEASTPDGARFPVVCTGGRSAHPRRVLGRFQRYTQAGKFWGWAEIYENGLTPPADQYLVQDVAGAWIAVEESVARSAIMARTPFRAKWSRQCPKCDRHYVFDLETLHARIISAADNGALSLDLAS